MTRIIAQQYVRAISNDGVHWRIQIQKALPATRTERQFSLFGLWSLNDGIKKFPVHPQQATPQAQQLAEKFTEQLSEYVQTRDFPIRDNIECWLLDTRQQPLALLAACQTNQTLPEMRQPRWLPCAPNDHTFISTHLQQHDHGPNFVFHQDILAQQIHQCAGQQRQTQWFQRQSDGSGIAIQIHRDVPYQAGQHLSADKFPHFLLRQQWDEQNQQQLINDYFHWQSPWLLTLPDLTIEERQSLETQACDYPRRLSALYHLYPEILDNDLITKTLVKAKLEKTIPADSR